MKLRGDICHQYNSLPCRIISRKILCLNIWTLIFFPFQWTKITCSPYLLMGIICQPTSSSPEIVKISLDYIIVCGWESCSSISVCWSLDFVAWPSYSSPYNWTYSYFCFYQPVLEIIVFVINISWTSGVRWLNWSILVLRDKLRRPIKNGALGVNNTPPL